MRITLNERRISHLRSGKITFPKIGEGSFKFLLFSRFCLKIPPIQRYLSKLDLSQTLFHALGYVFLRALNIGNATRQLFILPTQHSHFATQGFDLIRQVEQTASKLRIFFIASSKLFGSAKL